MSARRETLSTAVSIAEKREVQDRIRTEGLKNESTAVRRVMLAWARGPRVRYAVEAYWQNPAQGGLI